MRSEVVCGEAGRFTTSLNFIDMKPCKGTTDFHVKISREIFTKPLKV